VFLDTLTCLVNPRVLSRRTRLDPVIIRREAQNWFLSLSVEPYSFEWCSHMLSIEPEPIREKLLRAGIL